MTNYIQAVGYAGHASYRQGSVAAASQLFENQGMEECTDVCRGRMLTAAVGDTGRTLDVSWLPSAAETYHISPNIQDYVIAEIPIVTVSIPNRRAYCFPFSEVSKFRFLYGRPAFRSFVGKPTFIDHNNQIKEDAKGVHFDSSLHPWKKARNGAQIWRISVLAGFDRTKDEPLALDILKKRRTGYSMGALVDFTTCSICGDTTSGNMKCKCPVRKGDVMETENGPVLKYDDCHNINYIETSSVEEPADFLARTTLFWG